MSVHTARLKVPHGSGATTAARTAARSALRLWGFTNTDWLNDATLVITELVTNAIRHGGGLLALDLRAVRGQVTVSVTDRTRVRPHRRRADLTGGRGLSIIDALSRAWGVRPNHAGKCVWVLLPTSARPGLA
ncbi:ATP-binding protein [Actinoplanes sp. HUAS TT8]|uniref:ATP-binding protein n=1 Tax=Actinoplanes sp. HUAS TT8 TaxID=3447453 RepID=UPI003F526001